MMERTFRDTEGELIVEDRGRLYLREDDKRTFLCSLSPNMAVRPGPGDTTIEALGRLSITIPLLAKGKCPACETHLEVVDPGRYLCSKCGENLVNEAGYRLPALLSEEILRGIVAGRDLGEFTTVNIPTMPSGVKTVKPVKPSAYAQVCPKCFTDLNQRGECGKCKWTPTESDKLWEQILRIAGRVVTLDAIGEGVLQFESNHEICKIYLKETSLGFKFEARFENVTRDNVECIVGRPKAIINWVVEQVSTKPVRPVNRPPVNSPIQETGHRFNTTRESGNHKRELSKKRQLTIRKRRIT